MDILRRTGPGPQRLPRIRTKPPADGISRRREVLRRLLGDRVALASLAVIAALLLLFIIGPLVWTCSPTAADLAYGARPP
ncbi:MAG: hypothetical protein WC360_09665, partial [Opitutales bacterium]